MTKWRPRDMQKERHMVRKTKTGALPPNQWMPKITSKLPEIEKRQGFLYKFQRKHDFDNLISDFLASRSMRQ